MFALKCIILIILVASSSTAPKDDDAIVQLPKGKIQGHILKSEGGKPYYAFQEIPYAAPPVGSNRFQLPKDPEPWSGVLSTKKNTVVCYQKVVKYKNLNISEDCLYINVYTPVSPGTSKPLPVLVWIHGGGFVAESSTYEYYGPKYIMDHGVVVVTFNYRLGPFGFLTTNDDVMPANLGLKDQLLALEWVHDNIGLFGGNKSHVTIVGESAGSMSVGYHLLGPWKDNKVLFHAAILQSGSVMFFTKRNKARQGAFKVGHTLNGTFSSNDSKDLLNVLQQASAAKILEATSNTYPLNWPIMEKNGPFSYQMYDCLDKGNIKKIPIIIGFNSEEWIEDDSLNPNLKDLAAIYDRDPSKMVGSQFNLSSITRTIVGLELTRIYTKTSFEENLGAYIRFDSDNMFTTPITKQAELHAQYANVYLYQFSYKGDLGMDMNLPNISGCERVNHAEDLKYMWDDQTNSDLTKFPVADRLMLHRYVKMWTNFVKYHNPTPTKDPFLQNIIWPKMDPIQPNHIQYLNMNVTFEVRENPRYYVKVIKILDSYITSKDII